MKCLVHFIASLRLLNNSETPTHTKRQKFKNIISRNFAHFSESTSMGLNAFCKHTMHTWFRHHRTQKFDKKCNSLSPSTSKAKINKFSKYFTNRMSQILVFFVVKSCNNSTDIFYCSIFFHFYNTKSSGQY